MILDKDQLKYITQAITPDQATYVAQVSNILDNVSQNNISCNNINCGVSDSKNNEMSPFEDDILILNKVQAFQAKFKDIQWLLNTETLRYKLDSLYYNCSSFLNESIPLFRSAYQYTDNIFSTLTLPENNDVLDILNEFKDEIYSYINKKYESHNETPERLSIKQHAMQLLQDICKCLYEYRLARCGDNYNKTMTADDKCAKSNIQETTINDYLNSNL